MRRGRSYSPRRSTRPRMRFSGYAGWTCSFSLRCQTLMTRAGNTGDAPRLVAITLRPRLGNVCRSDGAVDDFASPFKGSEDRILRAPADQVLVENEGPEDFNG